MKVFISVDMEGICGVTSLRQISSSNAEYGPARLWMTDDVNAAVAGAMEGGATEILVRDAHGPAINILPDRLHPAARLMTGWNPSLDMLQGCDESYRVAFFIGYHPGPGMPNAVLSHTYSMEAVRGVEINGIPAGETLINALQAGTYGVPVGLVTGEQALREEIAGPLPQAELVVTKTGYGYQSALLEPMEACRARIRQAASEVVGRCSGPGLPPPYRPTLPIRAHIEFFKAEACLASRLIPGVEVVDPRAIDLHAATAQEFVRRFQLLMQVFYGLKS